jgi:hypothetical protein
MDYKKASNLRIKWNGRPCKHKKLEVIYFDEKEQPFNKSGQYACQDCGYILSDEQVQDVFHADDFAQIREACFRLAQMYSHIGINLMIPQKP